MADKSGWWVELVDSSGTKEVTRVNSVSPRWVRNDAGDNRISTARDDSINDYARVNAEMRLYYGDPAAGGTLFWRGFLHNTDPEDGDMTLDGPGITHILDEAAPDSPVTYTDIATYQAIEDYFTTYVNAVDSVTVYEDELTQVANQENILDVPTGTPFLDLLSIPNTKPAAVQNGILELLPTARTFEAEDSLNENTQLIVEQDGNFSGDAAVEFSSTSHTESTTFSFDHVVPDGALTIAPRWVSDADADISLDISIDGTVVFAGGNSFWGPTIEWSPFTTLVGDLDTSSHTLTVEVSQEDGAGDPLVIDEIAVLDNRFNYFYDIDGPETYPDEVLIEFDDVTAAFDLVKGYLSVTDDDAGVTRLQLSFDSGSTWVPSDGSELDVDSIEAATSLDTRSVRARVGLGRTGATGDQGASISTLTIDADGSERSVIEELELTGSHLDNVQTLHDYWDGTFIVGHEPASIPVTSYQYGQDIEAVQQPLPGRIDDTKPTVAAGNYANRVVLRGAADSNGNRPESILQDDDAVANDPRVITLGSPPIYDLDITTEAGAKFRARSLLKQAQRAGQLRGTVDLGLPHKALAGYQYLIDFGDGERYYTAEEVSVEGGGRQIGTTIKTIRESGLGREIEQLTSSKASKDEVG